MLFFSFSIGVSQRTNVISCVTVHDSDSSTASPLTPLPRTNVPAGTLLSRQAKSLAVVAPSVKTAAVSRGRLDTGMIQMIVIQLLCQAVLKPNNLCLYFNSSELHEA